MDDKLSKYLEELKNDTILDQLNLEEMQLKLPAIKAKYLKYLFTHKEEMVNLEELEKKAIIEISEKIEKEAEVKLSKITIENTAKNHELIRKIIINIKKEHLYIELIEKALNIITSMSYDIKNLLELKKLEIT